MIESVDRIIDIKQHYTTQLFNNKTVALLALMLSKVAMQVYNYNVAIPVGIDKQCEKHTQLDPVHSNVSHKYHQAIAYELGITSIDRPGAWSHNNEILKVIGGKWFQPVK